MTVATAFRAVDPAIMVGFRAWQDASREWGATITALADELLPGHPPVKSWGHTGQRLVGFSWDRHTDGDPPPLWRYVTGGRGVPFVVPKKNTNAGRALHARVADVPVLDDPPLPGMPSEWWEPGVRTSGFRVIYPSIEVMGDDLFLTWRVTIDGNDGMGHSADTIDAAVWERVPLSVYYAAKEARDAEHADAVG